MTRQQHLAVLGLFALGAVAGCREPMAAAPSGTVTVTVVDETGRRTPCMVAIRDLDSDTWVRVPQPFLANEQRDKRSRRPQWRKKQPFHTSGQATIRLPPGRYHFEAGKGPEYRPATAERTVVAGDDGNVTLSLERFVDMPAIGWWSGDTHVHVTRNRRDDNDIIRWAAQAEDIHVAHLLEMGDIETVVWPQYAWAGEGSVRDGRYWLTVGQEDPRTNQIGHALVLGAPQLIRDTSRYYFYDEVFAEARAQGALTGLAHFVRGKFKSERSGDMLFPRGLVDFVELLDNNNKLRTQSYYDVLNLGFRATAVAGSDYPWGSHIGDQRVYAYVAPDVVFHPDRWLEAVRRGETFVTQGPMLELRVNGRPIGSELHVTSGAQVVVEARARGATGVGAPSQLELVVMGEVVDSRLSTNAVASELRFNHELTATGSLWIAARATAHNGAQAHTSPVYILVDGKPVVATGAKLDWALDRAVERLSSIRDASFVPNGQRVEFRQRVDEALAFYEQVPYRPVPSNRAGP